MNIHSLDVKVLHNINITLYLLFISFLLIFGFSNSMIHNCDIWWHLQNGKLLIEDQTYPSPDQYSYISKQSEWVVHSWLADCFFYTLNKYLGYDSLTIFRLFIHLFFSIGCAFICYKEGIRLDICIIISIFACYMVCDREIRPFLFSEIGIFLLYCFVRNPKPSKYYFIIFPLLSIIWVNSHPFSLIFTSFLAIILLFLLISSYFHIIPIYYSRNWYILAFLFILFSFLTPNPVKLLIRTVYAPTFGTLDWKNLYFVTFRSPFYFYIKFIIIHIATVCFLYYSISCIMTKNVIKIIDFFFGILCISLSFLFERTQWMIIFPLISFLSYHHIKLSISSHPINYKLPIIFYIILQISRLQLPHLEIMPVNSIEYWNNNKYKGNIFCKWTWSGFVNWSTKGTAKIFVDTRIEPFTQNDISLSQLASYDIIKYLGELVNKDTEYLLLDYQEVKNTLDEYISKRLLYVIYKKNNEILLRINREKVKKIYG